MDKPLHRHGGRGQRARRPRSKKFRAEEPRRYV